MNILIVKLSSLGDVLHNLPIVWDIRRQYPLARIDWVVEEAYVELLTPLLSTPHFRGIDRIIPISLRRFRRQLKWQTWRSTWAEFHDQKAQLQNLAYDLILDTQGLLKSALVAALARKEKGARVIGLGNRTQYSGYEPLARMFYDHSVRLPSQYHAVDRSRALTAVGLATANPSRSLCAPQFYPQHAVQDLYNAIHPLKLVRDSYVMCFHASARQAKCWPTQDWIALGKVLALQGLQVVFPWGNQEEKLLSEYLVKKVPYAISPAAFSIQEAFVINAQAKLVIGVDTGLTHLAAILGVPTIEIYVDSPRWKTEAYWHHNSSNLGDMRQPPDVKTVIESLEKVLNTNSIRTV